MKILGICGSLQAESANLALLRKAQALAPVGMEITIYDGIRDLPHFNPDLEGEVVAPAVAAWRAALARSDAFLIASPEYGHSLPGALKNAIDWVIGSGELAGALVAVTASVPAPERGTRGLKALCITLQGVGARIVGGDPIVRGASFDEELATLLEAVQERAGQAFVPFSQED